MAISFEALMNAGQKIKQPVGNLFNLLTNKETPEMTPIQLDTEGRIDPQASLDLAQQTIPRTPSEHFFGRTLTADENTFNPETGEAELKTYSNTRPGFLTGLATGMQENYNNDFSINNLRPNNKGIGHRIGEGLGSLAKILATTGGDAWVAGNQGLDKAMARQGIRTNNQLYRNALEQQGVDTSNIRGYIGDDAFKSMLTGQQLKDNAEYRNMLLQTQMKNQEIANQMAREKLLYQQKQDAIENALKARGLNIQENKILQDNKPKKLEDLNAVSNQLKRFEDTFANMPNKLESNTLGRLRNMTGLQTEQEANFNSQRTLLFNKIARDLGGEKGVLSDQDIKRIENALPNYTDSYAQKQAKMQAIYALLEDRLSVEGASIQPQTNNDPLGIL